MMYVSVLYALVLFLVSGAVLIASFLVKIRLRSGVFRKCFLFSLYLTVVCGLYFLNLRSLAFSGTGGSIIAGFFILGFFGLIFVLPFFIHSLAPGGGNVPVNVFWALAAAVNIVLRMISGFPVPDLVLVLTLLYSIFGLQALTRDPSVPDTSRPIFLRMGVFFLAAFPLIGIDLAKSFSREIREAVAAFFPLSFFPLVFTAFIVLLFIERLGAAAPAAAGVPAPRAGASPGGKSSREALLRSFALSARETEVLFRMLDGQRNGEIADALFISESTVKKHINSIYRKSGIDSRVQLLRRLL